MPDHGKQEANNSLSEAYKTLLVGRERLLEQRRRLLGEKAFIELKEKQQLEYSSLNIKLMENYWNGFEIAKADNNFEMATQDFQKAFEMGFFKANTLFLEQNANEEKHKAYFLSEPYFITGLRYHLGLGYSQNQKEAVHFYRKSANQGDALAQFTMGFCHENGIGGVVKDGKETVRWHRLAAEQGNALAQSTLGFCYQNGIGVVKDEKEAVRWYRLAAEQGHAHAQFKLGYCYNNGIGVAEDAEEAVHWYRLAAEQGNIYAQHNLGFDYQNGIGVVKDEKEAVRWYRLAAEQENVYSQYNLGVCYTKGIGVVKDEKEAVRWYRLAAERGHANSHKALDTLTTPLANFTVALLKKNHTKAIELALNDEELESLFFTEELVSIAKKLEDKNSVTSFLQTLQAQAQKLNKNINASLINGLLSLNKAISTHSIKNSDEIALLMTELVDAVSIADAEDSQVKELLHFFCNLYDDNTPEVVLESLITLWHRAQSLKISMNDSGLNQLMAARIVSHLFENKYRLKCSPDFKESDLAIFIFAYKKTPTLTIETLNALLSEPLLSATAARHQYHTGTQSRSSARFFNRDGSSSLPANINSGQMMDLTL